MPPTDVITRYYDKQVVICLLYLVYNGFEVQLLYSASLDFLTRIYA